MIAPVYETRTVFLCDCHTPEHQLVVDEDEDMFRISFRLNNYLGFFGRLRAAIGYILGYREADYAELILRTSEATKLASILRKETQNDKDISN